MSLLLLIGVMLAACSKNEAENTTIGTGNIEEVKVKAKEVVGFEDGSIVFRTLSESRVPSKGIAIGTTEDEVISRLGDPVEISPDEQGLMIIFTLILLVTRRTYPIVIVLTRGR